MQIKIRLTLTINHFTMAHNAPSLQQLDSKVRLTLIGRVDHDPTHA